MRAFTDGVCKKLVIRALAPAADTQDCHKFRTLGHLGDWADGMVLGHDVQSPAQTISAARLWVVEL